MVFPIVFKHMKSILTICQFKKQLVNYAYLTGILKLLLQAWSRMWAKFWKIQPLLGKR